MGNAKPLPYAHKQAKGLGLLNKGMNNYGKGPSSRSNAETVAFPLTNRNPQAV